ncbi:hypothetical protein CYMTET_21296 [Cymbomonas tetramitiformis]|uniref:Uncharacterized protein n=1 Tax=Cymbomonas tetramitiformis TaxID=36881 RepID=A0AAE0G2B1_9CHLO|nr:hypothetical protein CYMTET_21296 [Cymbomonas tetramitiformis]
MDQQGAGAFRPQGVSGGCYPATVGMDVPRPVPANWSMGESENAMAHVPGVPGAKARSKQVDVDDGLPRSAADRREVRKLRGGSKEINFVISTKRSLGAKVKLTRQDWVDVEWWLRLASPASGMGNELRHLHITHVELEAAYKTEASFLREVAGKVVRLTAASSGRETNTDGLTQVDYDDGDVEHLDMDKDNYRVVTSADVRQAVGWDEALRERWSEELGDSSLANLVVRMSTLATGYEWLDRAYIALGKLPYFEDTHAAPIPHWTGLSEGHFLSPEGTAMLHPSFIHYVHQVWNEGRGERPSTGMLATILALHFCGGGVNLYGFDNSAHFYSNQYHLPEDRSTLHPWDVEVRDSGVRSTCLLLPVVAVNFD